MAEIGGGSVRDRERRPTDWHRRRGYYTVGWVIAVLTLYVAHELDGHWLGAVIVVAGYVAGGVYVSRQELRHG